MIKITEDEWKAEIDSFHVEHLNSGQTTYILTDEQIKYITYCRSKSPPIPWRGIVELFKKHGWRVSHTTLLEKWRKTKKK